MRALKALVIGMGVVIVALMGMVVWGLLRQTGDRQPPPVAATVQSPGGGSGSAGGFESVDLAAPAGCRLAEARPDGAGRLLLRLDGPRERGCQQVLIVDQGDGSLRGRLRLDPGQ